MAPKKAAFEEIKSTFYTNTRINEQRTVKILAKKMQQLNKLRCLIYAEIVQSKYVKGLHICAG